LGRIHIGESPGSISQEAYSKYIGMPEPRDPSKYIGSATISPEMNFTQDPETGRLIVFDSSYTPRGFNIEQTPEVINYINQHPEHLYDFDSVYPKLSQRAS